MNADIIANIKKAAEAAQQATREWAGATSNKAGYAQAEDDAHEALQELLRDPATVLELCRLAEERVWQPIETAPRDGTRIMLGHPAYVDESGEKREGVSAQGRWFDGYADGPDDMGHDGGFMDCDFDCFSFPRSFGADKYRTKGLQPTHWMPLPEPPK